MLLQVSNYVSAKMYTLPKNKVNVEHRLILLAPDSCSQLLPRHWLLMTISQLSNKFHGHFATPLEYVISLIHRIRLLNHIYLTMTIPLLLIKIKESSTG